MSIATIISAVRATLAISLVPASVIGGLAALLWAMNAGIDPEMAIFPITLANLVLVAVWLVIAVGIGREYRRQTHEDVEAEPA